MSAKDVIALMQNFAPPGAGAALGYGAQGGGTAGAAPQRRQAPPQQQQTGATGTWQGGAPPSQAPSAAFWPVQQAIGVGQNLQALGTPTANFFQQYSPFAAASQLGQNIGTTGSNIASNMAPVAGNALTALSGNVSGIPAQLQTLLAQLQGMGMNRGQAGGF
jgi:hypothetical protein